MGNQGMFTSGKCKSNEQGHTATSTTSRRNYCPMAKHMLPLLFLCCHQVNPKLVVLLQGTIIRYFFVTVNWNERFVAA